MLEQLAEARLIDKHNLDEGWVEQPDVFWRVCEELARANHARDAYKHTRDQIVAQAGADIRVEAVKSGKKMTEASIQRELEDTVEVVAAREHYQQLCYMSERWAGLKETFQQRSYALKDLTALHIANYYQTNSGGERRDTVAQRNRDEAGAVRRVRLARKD